MRKKQPFPREVDLLLEAYPLLLDSMKVDFGIDLSGNEYKLIAKKERSSAAEVRYQQKVDAYLKASAEFKKNEEEH